MPGWRRGARGRRGRPVVRSGLAAVAVTALAGCGGGGPVLASTALGLPTAPSPRPLYTHRLSTSPDGGIYVNPDPITVTWVGHRDVRAVERLLGSSGGAWAPLHALGDFTLVAVRVRNDGKAASDPQLDAIQVASDDAPPALSAAQRRFYHPMWPLAALATLPLSDECAVHLDPGQSAEVVLVYPPLRRTATILWGVYADFDTYLPAEGGAVPEGLGDLHPHACTAPTPPGA